MNENLNDLVRSLPENIAKNSFLFGSFVNSPNDARYIDVFINLTNMEKEVVKTVESKYLSEKYIKRVQVDSYRSLNPDPIDDSPLIDLLLITDKNYLSHFYAINKSKNFIKLKHNT